MRVIVVLLLLVPLYIAHADDSYEVKSAAFISRMNHIFNNGDNSFENWKSERIRKKMAAHRKKFFGRRLRVNTKGSEILIMVNGKVVYYKG